MVSKSEQRFIRLNLLTIIFTLLLILAGGVVRSTGSGMGCPDWPKCFDQYVPPTHISQLPFDYKERYVSQRLAKNNRFANTLEKMGKADLADSIRNDQSILIPETFNVAKTWTEYVNRLMGAITGFLLLVLTVYSFAYRKKATRIICLSFINLVVVAFQAWLGSIVVSTNLMAWIVTVHMLLALVILAILVYTYNYSKELGREPSIVMSKIWILKTLLLFSLATSVLQITLGTEVREAIDAIAKGSLKIERLDWIASVGEKFTYHRDIAIFILILNVLIYKLVMDKFHGKAVALWIANGMVLTLVIQIMTGLLLSNFALPPYAQAMHILFSTLLFSLQYYLYLLVYRTKTYQPN